MFSLVRLRINFGIVLFIVYTIVIIIIIVIKILVDN